MMRIPREPGTTPLDHLKHTLDAFADSDCPDDKLAITATIGVFGDLRTGLTWGDLRAIADELDTP
jgi:hypothetical protein